MKLEREQYLRAQIEGLTLRMEHAIHGELATLKSQREALLKELGDMRNPARKAQNIRY